MSFVARGSATIAGMQNSPEWARMASSLRTRCLALFFTGQNQGSLELKTHVPVSEEQYVLLPRPSIRTVRLVPIT